MRASSRTPSPIRLLAWAAALSAGAVGVAACADSIHLDPPGGTGGGSISTGTHGADGGPTQACRSNPDCGYPTPVCDTVAHECVECLTFSDCGEKPGTVCSLGACTCPTEGAKYCAAGPSSPARCVDTQTSPTDCGGCGKACFGSCVAGKCADKWRPTSMAGAPAARSRHVAVWTGDRMFVWGGQTAGGATNTGGLYDPATDTWAPVSTINAPSPRTNPTAVWDDAEKVVLVWGGVGVGGKLATGAMYDPATNTWATMPTANGPSGRVDHTAVFATFTVPFMGASHGMIVWGGTDANGHIGDGFVFDPAAKKWAGALPPGPTARAQHTAVWDTGTRQMIVWGGYGIDVATAVDNNYLADGSVFDPSSATWTPLPAGTGGPIARAAHTAVFASGTPSSMIVWGGYNGTELSDGARYQGGAWGPLSSPSPEERQGHTAVWMDASNQMIIFGGSHLSGLLDTAWSLDGATSTSVTWTQLPTAPAARVRHTAVAAGSSMIVWGGDGVSGPLGDGAIYDASP